MATIILCTRPTANLTNCGPSELAEERTFYAPRLGHGMYKKSDSIIESVDSISRDDPDMPYI